MKTGAGHLRPNRQILEEASCWFVDFRVGDVDACAREEFRKWLQRSPEHIHAYLEIAGTYVALPSPNPAGTLDVQALIESAHTARQLNIVPIDAGRAHEVSGEIARGRKVRTRVVAVAASVLLAPILALSAWFYMQRDSYATTVGEQRSLMLDDGSTIELNSHSRVRVRYTEGERRIDLLEGQALFGVAKNNARPFIVYIGDTQVRAVGTQFDVYRKRNGTIVTVVEGRVAVLPARLEIGRTTAHAPTGDAINADAGTRVGLQTKWAQKILLAAGEQVTVTPTFIANPVRANVKAAMAWTEHQLIFDGTPLVEVAEEFNRYNRRLLIVDQRQLRDFHVSGTYSSTNPDSLLRFLRVQPGLKLIETEDEIRVMRLGDL